MELDKDLDIFFNNDIYNDICPKSFLKSFFGGDEEVKNEKFKILRMRTPYYIRRLNFNKFKFTLDLVKIKNPVILGSIILKNEENLSKKSILDNINDYDKIMCMYPIKNDIKYDLNHYIDSKSGFLFLKITLKNDINIYKENINKKINDEDDIDIKKPKNDYIIARYINFGVYIIFVNVSYIDKIEVFNIYQKYDDKTTKNKTIIEPYKEDLKTKKDVMTNKLMFLDLYNDLIKDLTIFD